MKNIYIFFKNSIDMPTLLFTSNSTSRLKQAIAFYYFSACIACYTQKSSRFSFFFFEFAYRIRLTTGILTCCLLYSLTYNSTNARAHTNTHTYLNIHTITIYLQTSFWRVHLCDMLRTRCCMLHCVVVGRY